MDKEAFKLITRRWIALPMVGAFIVGSLSLIGCGIWMGQIEMFTLGAGALFPTAGIVVGFYFGKKISEE